MVLRRDARARHGQPGPRAPGPPGHARSIRVTPGWRVDALGGCGGRSGGGKRRDGRHPPGHANRIVGPGAGGLAAIPASGDLRGRTPLRLAGSLSSALLPGPWHWPASPRATPFSPSGSRQSPSLPLPRAAGGSPCRSSRARRSPNSSGSTRPGLARDPFRGVGCRMDCHRLGQRGQGPAVPVRDFDLVQEVRVPAGDDVVSFRYRPPHLLLASLLSLGATVLLVVLLLVWLAAPATTPGSRVRACRTRCGTRRPKARPRWFRSGWAERPRGVSRRGGPG